MRQDEKIRLALEAVRQMQTIYEKILGSVERQRVSSDILDQLTDPECPAIDNMIKRLIAGWEVVMNLPLVVESLPLQMLIREAGLDVVDPCINEDSYPIEKNEASYRIWVKLFRYDKVVPTPKVLKDLDSQKYRPLTIVELLRFAHRYPEIQFMFSIVGLGSLCADSQRHWCAPCLDHRGDDRELCIRNIGEPWTSYNVFAATGISVAEQAVA